MYVTVLDGEAVMANTIVGSEVQVGTYGQALRGEVLHVTAVNLPYIVVRCLSHADLAGRNLDLDSRRVTLMRLSDEFVAAKRLRTPWWKFWKWGA